MSRHKLTKRDQTTGFLSHTAPNGASRWMCCSSVGLVGSGTIANIRLTSFGFGRALMPVPKNNYTILYLFMRFS